MVDIGDSVRGKDCYIIQTGTKWDFEDFRLNRLIIGSIFFQGLQQQHHGTFDYGLCMVRMIMNLSRPKFTKSLVICQF